MPILFPACRRLAGVCLSRRVALIRCKHIVPVMATGKLKSENFSSILTDDVLRIADVIQSVKRADTGEGHEVRLVGGAVRDLLMDRKPKDVDLSTTMLPDEMFSLCVASGFRTIATGLKHGTVTVVTELGQNVEITSLRIDAETDGRHATVKYTTDWQLDAARRDLTINAMSLGLDGTLYDYFDGERDIHDRRVQFVGDPVRRIQEDYLRILRYFRFHGRIAVDPLVHEEVTASAIRQWRDGLRQVSVERILVEISVLLCGPNAPAEVRMMYSLGVAESIGLPAPGRLGELERVWTAQLASGRPMSAVALLLALHDDNGTADVAVFAEKWKLSKAQRLLLLFVAAHRSLVADLKHYQDMLTDMQPASKAHVDELLVYQGRTKMADEIAAWPVPTIPINGRLLKQQGIVSGQSMGVHLSRLRKTWQESNFTMTADGLLEAAKAS